MKKINKRNRETEYIKLQNELKMTVGQERGWLKVDKKLDDLKKEKGVLTPNDIKSMEQWIAKEKEERKTQLKIELEDINEFMKMRKEHPEAQIHTMLIRNQYLPPTAAIYSSMIERDEAELKETTIKLRTGFKPLNPTFAYMNDPEWQKLMETIEKKKKDRYETELSYLKKSVAEVEEKILEDKEIKDKRVAQIEVELKELGEQLPKKELSYIG